MRKNVSLLEGIYLWFFAKKARVEIINNGDIDAKYLKPLAVRVAETLSSNHPDLKILGLYRTDNLWHFKHNFLFRGYVISIPRDYNLHSLKKTCIKLELDRNGSRFVDIDVYRTPLEKISRNEIYPHTN